MVIMKITRCCNNKEKYLIEYSKEFDSSLNWLICDEHFQNDKYRKNVRRIQHADKV